MLRVRFFYQFSRIRVHPEMPMTAATQSLPGAACTPVPENDYYATATASQ